MKKPKAAIDKSLLKRILSYSKPYRGYLILSMICAIISVSATLYAPVVIGQAIDSIIKEGNVNFSNISFRLLTLGVVVAIAAFFQWLMNYSTNRVTHSTIRDLRRDLFGKFSKLPLKSIDTASHGDFMSRMVNDVDQVSDGLLQGFTQLFSGIVTIVGTICFMLTLDVIIGLVVILVTPLSLFVASFIAKRTSKHFKEQAAVKGEIGGYVEEMLTGQSIISIFGYQKRSIKKLEEINDRLYTCGVKAQFYSSLTNPCTRFVNSVVYVCVGVAGGLSVIYAGLSIGMLSAFLSYANQYTKPFNEISGVITELQSAFASAARIFSVLDMENETPDKENAITLTKCTGDIALRDVAFSYTSDRSLIENLNLTANAGQRIAIVGPTGCGKTTIINLLMRFYDVDQGSISVDSIDIRDITRKSLRSSYGMVLQDTWLFYGSIEQNIAYGKPEATRDEIINAAKKSHAHSFIKRLPQGYDTLISTGGDSLSQGQRQLLCIARVMLSLPPMLILDEATSSIDTRTELKIQKAFAVMMEGRTSFIVAHRLSTIKEADCILVMESGKIIEQGRHDELLKKNGFYASLYNSQFKIAQSN